MAHSETALAVELDWLLALPLESEALLTLWSAVAADLAALDPQPTACAVLQQAVERQRWLDLRGRCLDGDWLTALPAFLALLADAGPAPPACPEAAAWGLQLLQELHFRLLDPNAPAWELAADDRAELLWLAHALLERLEPLPEPTPERLPVLIEQLSRYGAIAWMERPGPEARERAIRLLLRLAWVNPESHPWALPALDSRISASLKDRQSGAPPAELPAAEPSAAPGLEPPAAPWREAASAHWLEQAIPALAARNPAIQAWSTPPGPEPSGEDPAGGET